MKPELLKLTNIGPFRGTHTIDFSLMDSIFLVCGKTGAGKTTIFDAISYAFYSKPLGSRSQIARSLRSQFAPEEETAEVELIFTMGPSKYKIFRRLPFLRPGKKSENPEESALAEWDGRTWKDLSATNKRDTDKKILNIINLNEKEFARIVLLPQGEFAAFLRENSSQKKETLEELFPISRYTQIMENLKELEKAETYKIKNIEDALEALGKEFDADSYPSKKSEFEKEIELIKKNYNQISKKIEAKISEKEQAKVLKEKKEELTAIKTRLENLNAHKNDIKMMEEAVEKARRASSLTGLADSVKKLNSNIVEYKTDIEKKIKDLNSVTEILEALKAQEKDIESEKENNAALKQNLDRLKRAAEVYKEIEEKSYEKKGLSLQKKEKTEKLAQTEKNIQEIKDKVSGYLEIISELDNRKERAETSSQKLSYLKRLFEIASKKEKAAKLYTTHKAAAEKNYNDLQLMLKDIEIEKELFEKLKKEKKDFEINQEASAFAVHLKDGEPCPVCGSIHHPSPAVENTESIFSLDEKIQKCERSIEKFNHDRENLNNSLTARNTDADWQKEQMDELDRSFLNLNEEFKTGAFIFKEMPLEKTIGELLPQASKEAEKDNLLLKEAQTANTAKINLEQKLSSIQNEKEALSEALTNIKIKESELNTILHEKKKQYDDAFKSIPPDIQKENIDDTIEGCNEMIFASDRKISGYEERLKESNDRHTSIKAGLIQRQEQLAKWEKTLLEEEENLKTSLEQKGFSSINELLDSILPEEKIGGFEETVTKFKEEKITLEHSASGLEKDLEGKTFVPPENIEDEIIVLQKNLDEEQDRLTEVKSSLDKLKDLFERRQNLLTELKQRAEEARLITELSLSLNGSNKYKLKFDIWMLSAFLREIIVYANTRLERMSGGRYVLKLSKELSGNNLSGLDMEIYDAYTGGIRPTASLSGGETFMVSISLALGLADSIQTRSGGIRLDSMFIDEGFGSLDEASLENAISILDEVRGNRMVGIISHVSELKTRIPQKIEIEKTANGSAIKIRG
ncbi:MULTISPECIES: AAA family ATPase [unclassified Treponema]|uniref:AAA family ATPase n=1 Tax=unclassified Treponema TaxID=2638727 RepID=UPI0020A60B32|nr:MULTISPECIES: AAA family ATPase [unclassified Treponema]UTC66828.1 AAA family ATPase [Treponema sp. OMZ 789]UTC69560.1 AAA family ATPase [Treponema sp. OMZ 790]UTC72273.1 AAA family ATPase [Treponema sp. OMZ 791]